MGQRSQSVPSSPNHMYKCTRCGKFKPSSCFFTYKRLGQTTSDSICSSCRTLFNRKHNNRINADEFVTTNRIYDNIASSPHSAFYTYQREDNTSAASVISVSPETITSTNSMNSSISSPQIYQQQCQEQQQEPPPPPPPPHQHIQQQHIQQQQPQTIPTTTTSIQIPQIPLQSYPPLPSTQIPPQIETSQQQTVNDVNYFSNLMSLPSPIYSMGNLFNSLNTPTPLISPSTTVTTPISSPSSALSNSNNNNNNNNSSTLEQLQHIQQLLFEQQQQQQQQQQAININLNNNNNNNNNNSNNNDYNYNNCYSPIHTLFFCNNNSNSNNLINTNSHSRMMFNPILPHPQQQQQQQSISSSSSSSSSLSPQIQQQQLQQQIQQIQQIQIQPLPIQSINNNTIQIRNYNNLDSPITTTATSTTTIPTTPSSVTSPSSTTSSSTINSNNNNNINRRRSKSKKNQEIDFRISYENLRKLVTADVYNGLRKDKFNELVIYSNNATDIVTQIPDEKTRTNIMLNEITIFYHISSEEVYCKSCGKKIAQIECFIHENYVICKDCSLKVDIRDLSDWEYTGKRPIQLQCVRCKHIIPYHKFLKYNRKDEIKRQNTCSYCRLKQWIDYYRS